MTIKNSIKNVLFFYSIVLGIIYVPLVSFLSFQAQGTPLLSFLQFFTSDTFYYLSIARHSVGADFYTADGIYPTNGFHPLWGFILTKLFEIPEIYNSNVLQIYLVFGLSMFLVLSGMLFFGFATYKITNNFLISFFASVPGFYYLLFFTVAPAYNSTWSFINGMESPLSIFFFGFISFLLLSKKILLNSKISVNLFLTILVTLIIFSRLDDLFFLIPYLILVALFSNSIRQLIVKLILSAGIPVVVIVAYMMYNQSYADSYLPVSGLIKQGNWLVVNLVFFFTTLIPIGLINPTVNWSETSMRALQMFVPVFFSIFWIFYQIKPFLISKNKDTFYSHWLSTFWQWLRQPENSLKQVWVSTNYEKIVISVFGIYVILKGLYNIVSVYLMGQGHWYYAISVMIFNLMFAVLLSDFTRKNFVSEKMHLLSLSLIFLLIANSFINNKILSNYNSAYYSFWENSQEINSQILILDPDVKIIEYDDGVMSYFIDVPIMNGFGFTLDRQAFEAQYNGHLLELAHKRGYDVIGVMSYINFQPSAMNDSDSIRNALHNMPGIKLENLDLWKFEFLYKNPNSSAVFIKFKPIQ